MTTREAITSKKKTTNFINGVIRFCHEILNLLLWINESTWRRLKIHGPVKFNFKHFLFYSSKSKNDQKYEYFTILWITIVTDLGVISSEHQIA